MAETPLQWQFELLDKMSGTAAAMTSAVETLNSTLKKSSSAHDQLGEHQAKAGGHTEGFRHQLFETLEIAHRVGEGMMYVAEHVAELGKEMIEAAGHTEKLKLAMNVLTGEPEETEKFLKYLDNVSDKINMTHEQARGVGLELLRGGFKADEVASPMAAIADIRALNPGNEAGAGQAATDMFTNMMTVGHMTERSMMALKGLKISIPDVTQNLAEAYGVKTEAVKKMIEKGEITAKNGIAAIEKALQSKEGGTLGNLAVKAGGTVDMLMEKIKSFKTQLFEDLDTSAGFAQFRAFLQNVQDVLTGPEGKRTIAIVEELTDKVVKSLFGDLSGADGQEKLRQKLQWFNDKLAALPHAIEIITSVLKEAVPVVIGLAGALTGVSIAMGVMAAIANPWLLLAAGIGMAVVLIYKYSDEIWAVFKNFDTYVSEVFGGWYDKAFEWGTNLWKGFTDGIKKGVDAVFDAVEGLGSTAIESISSKLKTHSPSLVFAEMGKFSALGFVKGINDHTNLIDDAVDRAFSVDSNVIPISRGQSLGGGGSVNMAPTINIAINLDGSDGDSASQIAAAVRDAVVTEMASVWEQAALEQGAA